MTDNPFENDNPSGPSEASAADLESRVYQASEATVGGDHGNGEQPGDAVSKLEGEQTEEVNPHDIPWGPDNYQARNDAIRDISNTARSQGADRLELFVPGKYAQENEITDADVSGMGFHKTGPQADGTLWLKPLK